MLVRLGSHRKEMCVGHFLEMLIAYIGLPGSPRILNGTHNWESGCSIIEVHILPFLQKTIIRVVLSFNSYNPLEPELVLKLMNRESISNQRSDITYYMEFVYEYFKVNTSAYETRIEEDALEPFRIKGEVELFQLICHYRCVNSVYPTESSPMALVAYQPFEIRLSSRCWISRSFCTLERRIEFVSFGESDSEHEFEKETLIWIRLTSREDIVNPVGVAGK